MTFTVSLGYWLIPSIVTILSYVLATWWIGSDEGRDPFAMMFAGLAMLFGYGIATIISLIAWCVYFAVT